MPEDSNTEPPGSLVPDDWDLPEAIARKLGEVSGNQRAIIEGGNLLVLVHLLPTPDDPERHTLAAWRSPDGIWQTHPTPGGVPVLDSIFAAYEDKIDELEELEQSARRSHEFHNILEELSPILRAIRGIHRTLQQAHIRIPEDRDILLWRDDAAEVVRSAELLNDDARFGLQFIAASQAESQAAASHRLNMLIALFLPLTTLGAIFGMNMPNGHEDDHRTFILVLVAGIIAGLVLRQVFNTGKFRPDFKLPKVGKKKN